MRPDHIENEANRNEEEMLWDTKTTTQRARTMQPMLQQERQREITEKGRTVKNNMRKKYTTERRKESERRAEEEKTNKCKMRITTTIAIKIAKDAENTSTMNSKKKK